MFQPLVAATGELVGDFVGATVGGFVVGVASVGATKSGIVTLTSSALTKAKSLVFFKAVI